MSASINNFLKTIYQLSVTPGSNCKPGSIAKALNISNAATTDMARNLAEKKLVNYEKYHEIQLTEKGKGRALKVIRKQRLWETLLHQLFSINLAEISREAELLEHQTSDFLAEHINDYLANPQFDPHGDPIPSRSGKLPSHQPYFPLSRVKEKKMYRIKRLFSTENGFFEFCAANDITLSTELYVEKQFPEQSMTTVKTGEVKIVLNKEFANKIFVVPLDY